MAEKRLDATAGESDSDEDEQESVESSIARLPGTHVPSRRDVPSVLAFARASMETLGAQSSAMAVAQDRALLRGIADLVLQRGSDFIQYRSDASTFVFGDPSKAGNVVCITDAGHTYYPMAILRTGNLLVMRCQTPYGNPRLLVLDANTGAILNDRVRTTDGPCFLIPPQEGGVAVSDDCVAYATCATDPQQGMISDATVAATTTREDLPPAKRRKAAPPIVVHVLPVNPLVIKPRRVVLSGSARDWPVGVRLTISDDRVMCFTNSVVYRSEVRMWMAEDGSGVETAVQYTPSTTLPRLYDIRLDGVITEVTHVAEFAPPARTLAVKALCFHGGEVLLQTIEGDLVTTEGGSVLKKTGVGYHVMSFDGRRRTAVPMVAPMPHEQTPNAMFGVRFYITWDANVVRRQDLSEFFRVGTAARSTVMHTAVANPALGRTSCYPSLDGRSLLVMQEKVVGTPLFLVWFYDVSLPSPRVLFEAKVRRPAMLAYSDIVF